MEISFYGLLLVMHRQGNTESIPKTFKKKIIEMAKTGTEELYATRNGFAWAT